MAPVMVPNHTTLFGENDSFEWLLRSVLQEESFIHSKITQSYLCIKDKFVYFDHCLNNFALFLVF